MSEILYKGESYKIVGAMLNVHNELGCGFLEAVYQDALEIEFSMQGIPYEREKEYDILYKGHVIDNKYRVDFVCYDKIIVELKAIGMLLSVHYSQVLNYLKMSSLKLGILANFGESKLNTQRIIREQGW